MIDGSNSSQHYSTQSTQQKLSKHPSLTLVVALLQLGSADQAVQRAAEQLEELLLPDRGDAQDAVQEPGNVVVVGVVHAHIHFAQPLNGVLGEKTEKTEKRRIRAIQQ